MTTVVADFRFRLMSLLVAATLTIVTTVSEVSLSFCFILTAIEGTRRFGVAVGLPRLPAFEEPLASLALLLLAVDVLDDIRLLVLVLLLFGESSFPPPPPDGFSRWVSSLTPMVAPADDERSFSRAAARSLDDLVVRIGC